MRLVLEKCARQLVEMAAANPSSGIRNDSATVAGFLGDLTYIYEQTYDVKYADAKIRTFLSVDTSPGNAAESYKWHQFDWLGTPKPIDDYSADFPTAEISGVEFQTRIQPYGLSYNYSIQDLRRAAMIGQPLEARKANACRKGFEKLVEIVGAYGDAAASYLDPTGSPGMVGSAGMVGDNMRMYGFVNVPGIINVGDPTGALTGAGSLLNSKTAGFQTSLNWTLDSTPVSSILADFNAMQRTIVNTTIGVHEPDTLLLPTAIWTKLATAARSSTYAEDVILQYMQKQSPWLKRVVYWPVLDTAGLKQDNATAGPRVMLFENKPDNVSLIIGQEFEQFAPQVLNMAFKVPCQMRMGGIKVPYPKSICYLDGAAG